MRENLLRKCLQALKNNVRIPYNVIIINSGKHPLSLQDERIHVVNDPRRKGLGAKRQRFAEIVETEFLFSLDNDMIVWPRSLEVQIEALDENPHLAAVSGLHFTRRGFCGVADFEIEGSTIRKRMYDLVEILDSNNDLFEADFISIGHTAFRMKAVEDIAFDPNYGIGYEHLDTFLQLYYTDWKCVVHKKSWFTHLASSSPKEYMHLRRKATRIKASRKHFIKKWGYKPILPTIHRGTSFRKMLKRLATGQVYARAYMRAAAMYTRAQIYQLLHEYT